MATKLSRQEIYDIFITEFLSSQDEVNDDSEGGLVDVLAGVVSQVLSICQELTLDEFAKTFFESADGPEVTGGPDDLQTLAVDHFGDSFARPGASKSIGEVTFERPTTTKGDVTIAAGTVVQTAPNSNGTRTRFLTTAEVVMTGTSIIAQVEAETAGGTGDVLANKITNIETTLTDDSVTVTNDDPTAGGEDEQNDAQYRETLRNLLKSLKGATLAAIQATAKNVAGVKTATAIENLIPVIEYDIATGLAKVGATYFRMPFASVYVADANGSANAALVAAVQTEIDAVRAAGVKVAAIAADGVSINWTATITLNAGGPNFTELSVSKTKILESMSQYINELPIGTDFSRAAGNTAILAIWGPLGTNDITAFSTSVPTGDVDITATQKPVAGTVSIV